MLLDIQNTRAFCDGTRWYGIPAPFFPSKEKNYM